MPDHHGTLKKGGRRSAVIQSVTHSLNQPKVNPGRWGEKESEVDIKCKARTAIHGINALHYCTIRRPVSLVMPKYTQYHLDYNGNNAGTFILSLHIIEPLWLKKCIEKTTEIGALIETHGPTLAGSECVSLC